MITVVVLVIIGLLIMSVIVIAALEKGPSTADLALAYEHAWDALDFETIWALSALELRDGLDRRPGEVQAGEREPPAHHLSVVSPRELECGEGPVEVQIRHGAFTVVAEDRNQKLHYVPTFWRSVCAT